VPEESAAADGARLTDDPAARSTAATNGLMFNTDLHGIE
jgi:hypothetical protein